jgi:hypothetical protein
VDLSSVSWGDNRVVGLIGRDYILQTPNSEFLRLPVEEVETERIDAYYALHPGRLATRTPSIFLAALTVALLGAWAVQLSGHWGIGLLAAVAYLTSPEVYVRSSYGGYFAISNFLVLCMLIATAQWDASPKDRKAQWACLMSGLLAGLANHKLVLLPISFAFVTLFRWFRLRSSDRTVLHPTFIGFIGGTALFWTHGLLIDASAFWKEHVRTHLVDRVVHLNPLGYSGYPTPTELWTEFSRHTGYTLVPLGLLALTATLLQQRQGVEPNAAEGPDHGVQSLPQSLAAITLRSWITWILVTGVIFSIVDWRMTKHLSPLLIPLFLLPAAWSKSGWIARIIVIGTFSGLCVWNVMVLREVMADFRFLTITPAW